MLFALILIFRFRVNSNESIMEDIKLQGAASSIGVNLINNGYWFRNGKALVCKFGIATVGQDADTNRELDYNTRYPEFIEFMNHRSGYSNPNTKNKFTNAFKTKNNITQSIIMDSPVDVYSFTNMYICFEPKDFTNNAPSDDGKNQIMTAIENFVCGTLGFVDCSTFIRPALFERFSKKELDKNELSDLIMMLEECCGHYACGVLMNELNNKQIRVGSDTGSDVEWNTPKTNVSPLDKYDNNTSIKLRLSNTKDNITVETIDWLKVWAFDNNNEFVFLERDGNDTGIDAFDIEYVWLFALYNLELLINALFQPIPRAHIWYCDISPVIGFPSNYHVFDTILIQDGNEGLVNYTQIENIWTNSPLKRAFLFNPNTLNPVPLSTKILAMASSESESVYDKKASQYISPAHGGGRTNRVGFVADVFEVPLNNRGKLDFAELLTYIMDRQLLLLIAESEQITIPAALTPSVKALMEALVDEANNENHIPGTNNILTSYVSCLANVNDYNLQDGNGQREFKYNGSKYDKNKLNFVKRAILRSGTLGPLTKIKSFIKNFVGILNKQNNAMYHQCDDVSIVIANLDDGKATIRIAVIGDDNK